MNNLADAILQNTPQNPDELNSLLREVQMQELDSYQAIAFSTKDTNTQLMKERIIALLHPACEIHLLRSAKLFGGPF